MTFKDKAKEMLTERGLSEDEAEAVIEKVVAAPETAAMQGRWDSHIEGYPPQVVNVLWVTVKTHALEYIEATCPLAWFKPMFEESANVQ